jgi:hypothetical protein
MQQSELTKEAIKKFILDPQTTSFDGAGVYDASALVDALREAGYVVRSSYSQCTKASYEAHLVNYRGIEIDIVAANFMGKFVNVDVYKK